MHIHATNGVGVSVLNGTTNCTALGVELESGLSLARVPYGPVKLRITAQHPVQVEVLFEDEKRLTTTLSPGTHTLERGNDGQPILFQAPAERVCEAVDEDDDAPEVDEHQNVKLPHYVETALKIIEAGKSSVRSIPQPAPQTAVEDELSFSAVTKSGASSSFVAPADTIVASSDEKAAPTKRKPHGFLSVFVKHVEQESVPGVVPPSYDEARVSFQLNAPEDHLKAVAANFHRVVAPEPTTRRWCSCCNH